MGSSEPVDVVKDEGNLVGNRYILGASLGAGGLAYVRLATDRILGRTVAIKCMHPALRRNADDVKRVYREAVVAASIMHPNVCQTLDAGSLADGSPFVALEKLDGQSCEERLRDGRIAPPEALDIAIQTLAGIAAAHAAGVLHRDLKPANVFLVETERGERPLVKILDFGAAHSLQSSEITPAGLTVGTPQYIAPEQTSGAANLDQRVDVYGVGVLLYEMLTGRRAFAAATYPEMLKKVASGAVEPLKSLLPDLAPALVKAVHRAMSVDREFRFSSARDFSDALVATYEQTTGHRYVPPWALVAAPAYVSLRESSEVRAAAPQPPPMVMGSVPEGPVSATMIGPPPGPGKAIPPARPTPPPDLRIPTPVPTPRPDIHAGDVPVTKTLTVGLPDIPVRRS